MYITEHGKGTSKEHQTLEAALFYAVTYAYYQRDTVYIYGNKHRGAIAAVTVDSRTDHCLVKRLDEAEFPVPNE